MRSIRVLIAIASLSWLLVGCGTTSSTVDEHLCAPPDGAPVTAGRQSYHLGNTHDYPEHLSISDPVVSWALPLNSGLQVPHRLSMFNHMIGLVYADGEGSRVEFVDGLLGVVIRTDEFLPGAKAVEIVDGSMFITTELREFYRYDLGSGTVDWGFQENGSVRFAPVVLGEQIYLSSGTSQGDRGQVVSIDFETGETIWSAETPILEGNVYPISSAALAVTPGAVIVNGFGWLYAYDLETGEKCWDTEASKYGLASQFNIPTTNGEVVVFEANGKLMGLELRTGDLLWSADGYRPYSNIAISNGSAVTVGNQDELVSVDIDNGEINWTQSSFDFSYAEILISNDQIYATTDTGELIAVDFSSGNVIWSIDVGEVNTQLFANQERLWVLTDSHLISIVDQTP